jgi:hypothetical protein
VKGEAKLNCPKCESANTYIDDGMYACRTCGERWLPQKYQPYNLKVTSNKRFGEEKEMATRACRNCGRVNKIIGDDLDSGCYFAVRGLTKGTPEYNQRLAVAKAKFGDPNYKRGGKRTLKKTVKSATAKVRSTNITEGAVIDQLVETRDRHLAIAEKLTQAIELLQS